MTVQSVAEYYGLKPDRAGMIHCPYHRDNTPSMKVNYKDNRFYCFSCGRSGDAVDLVSEIFGTGLKAAALKIAADLDIPLTDRLTEQRETILASPSQELPPFELDKDGAAVRAAITLKRIRSSDIIMKHIGILAVRAVLDIKTAVDEVIGKYAPRYPDDEWSEFFCEAVKDRSKAIGFCEMLLDEDKAQRDKTAEEILEDVVRIYEKYREIIGPDGAFGSFGQDRRDKGEP